MQVDWTPMFAITAATLLLFGLVLTACSDSRAADLSADLSAWQGTWTLISSTYDGQAQGADMQWIVQGDEYRVRMNRHLDEVPIKFTLDAGRKRIDAVHHETPAGTYGGKVKGIYKISGNSLTVCYDLTSTHYPSSFEAKHGSRQVLYEFRRE